jgi:hypothetical protein
MVDVHHLQNQFILQIIQHKHNYNIYTFYDLLSHMTLQQYSFLFFCYNDITNIL